MKPGRKQSKPEWYGELAEQALRSAVAKLIAERRRTGDSLVIWRDGKVVRVLASELYVPASGVGSTRRRGLHTH